MQRSMIICVLILMQVGLLMIGMGNNVWAAKAGAGNLLGSCVVNNPGNGAVALKGTAVLVITSDVIAETKHLADVLFRLNRKDDTHFFRQQLFTPTSFLNYGELICRAINPDDTKDIFVQQDVQMFVDRILSAFGLEGKKLVITEHSIRNEEVFEANQLIPRSVSDDPAIPEIPGQFFTQCDCRCPSDVDQPEVDCGCMCPDPDKDLFDSERVFEHAGSLLDVTLYAVDP